MDGVSEAIRSLHYLCGNVACSVSLATLGSVPRSVSIRDHDGHCNSMEGRVSCRIHEVLNHKLEHVFVPCPRAAEIGNRVTGLLYCSPCWEQYWELTFPSKETTKAKAAEMNLAEFIEWYWSTHIFTGPMSASGQFDDFPYAIWSEAHP